MNELTALTVFNITENDPEKMEEAYETACFEIKSWFLKNPALPQLVLSKVNKLKILEEARCCLLQKKVAFPDIVADKFQPGKLSTWPEFYKVYHEELSKRRFQLSSFYPAPEVARGIMQLGEVEKFYFSSWLYFFSNLEKNLINVFINEKVKISSAPEPIIMIKAFESLSGSGMKKGPEEPITKAEFEALSVNEMLKVPLSLICTELYRIKKLTSQP